jgi:hypothetical protein
VPHKTSSAPKNIETVAWNSNISQLPGLLLKVKPTCRAKIKAYHWGLVVLLVLVNMKPHGRMIAVIVYEHCLWNIITPREIFFKNLKTKIL